MKVAAPTPSLGELTIGASYFAEKQKEDVVVSQCGFCASRMRLRICARKELMANISSQSPRSPLPFHLTMGSVGLSLQITLIVSLIADLGEPPVPGLLVPPEEAIVW